MLERLAHRGEDERGAVLVIVAGLLVVFMALAALAIDIGSFDQAQRQAQAAADAGALAASQDLPNNTAGAPGDGTTYALLNYPGATVTVTTPYNNITGRVYVKVSASTPSFFGQFLGLTHADVSASAVASGYGTKRQGAVFAYADGGVCGDQGIYLNGNNMTISGGVQSNGSLTLGPQSGGGSLPSAAYGIGPPACSHPPSGSPFGTGMPVAATPTPFPLDYRNGPTPTCTVTLSGDVSLATVASNTVYCDTTGTISITAGNQTATNVTFYAYGINVPATSNHLSISAPQLTATTYGLLFWQTGPSPASATTGQLSIGSNNSTLNGTMFAPNATLIFQGNASGTGFIEANSVDIEGNGYGIVGDGPVLAGSGYSLVQ
jgi:Flp pilus assembly protein TadG